MNIWNAFLNLEIIIEIHDPMIGDKKLRGFQIAIAVVVSS